MVGFNLLAACGPTSSNLSDVAFIENTPVIDGKLDSDLSHLIENEFNHILDLDNPEMDPVKVTYRMGYTREHFYLYIETDADGVSYHRRGYLWGDGYKLLLGLPQEDKLTDEYYVMTFSPTLEDDYLWDKQRIAAYNFTGTKKSFTKKTNSQEWSGNGQSGFEALIAWSDIQPYHPWFSKELGYNLYFAKGFDTEEHGYFPYGYAVVEDEAIWDEEIERRAYIPFTFEQPSSVSKQILLAQAERGHITIGNSISLNVAGLAPKSDRTMLEIQLLNASGKTVLNQVAEINVTKNLTDTSVSLDTASLDIGNYTLSTTANGHRSEAHITIVPDIKFDELRSSLELNQDNVVSGAVHTLLFKLQALKEGLAKLKPYDTCLLYTSPSPRDATLSRMPSSA